MWVSCLVIAKLHVTDVMLPLEKQIPYPNTTYNCISNKISNSISMASSKILHIILFAHGPGSGSQTLNK